MALDDSDKNWIKDTIIDALETVVLPRFDEHDERFDRLEGRMDSMERNIIQLQSDVRGLDMRIDDMDGRLKALENDIKELYRMQMGKDSPELMSKSFDKLPNREKILVLNTILLTMAKKEGITLPH